MKDHEIIIATYDYPYSFNMVVDGRKCEDRESASELYGDVANDIRWIAKEQEDEIARNLIRKIAKDYEWADCSVRLILVIDSSIYQFYYVVVFDGEEDCE